MKSPHKRSNRKHLGHIRQSRTRRLLMEPLEDRRLLASGAQLVADINALGVCPRIIEVLPA